MQSLLSHCSLWSSGWHFPSSVSLTRSPEVNGTQGQCLRGSVAGWRESWQGIDCRLTQRASIKPRFWRIQALLPRHSALLCASVSPSLNRGGPALSGCCNHLQSTSKPLKAPDESQEYGSTSVRRIALLDIGWDLRTPVLKIKCYLICPDHHIQMWVISLGGAAVPSRAQKNWIWFPLFNL